MKNNLLHEGYARRFAVILLCGLLSLGAATAVAQSPRAGSYESNQTQKMVKGSVVKDKKRLLLGVWELNRVPKFRAHMRAWVSAYVYPQFL